MRSCFLVRIGVLAALLVSAAPGCSSCLDDESQPAPTAVPQQPPNPVPVTPALLERLRQYPALRNYMGDAGIPDAEAAEGGSGPD